MDPVVVNKEIQELESLKKQAFWWRVGSAGAVTAILLTCLSLINQSVRGLTDSGPTQEAFASEVGQRFQTNVLPGLQNTAAQTLTEIRPQIETEFTKLNERVPELTEASLGELNTLQTSLPEKGSKIVADTFGLLLQDRETKIREMFPEATEENVDALVTNLSNEATTRSAKIGDKLFAPHVASMQNVVTNMEKIRLAEKPSLAGETANWETGLLFLDIFRDDLRANIASAKSASLSGPTAAAKPAAAKKGATK